MADSTTAHAAAAAPDPAPDPAQLMRSRRFVFLLVLAAIVGLVASLAAWLFLDLVHVAQNALFDDLPGKLGFETVPAWWPLPPLAVGGVIVALAIRLLPGAGGHIPAHGLAAAPTQPIELPGVIIAAVGGLVAGIVLGPEAPLIALGGGLGFIGVRLLRSDAPPEVQDLVASSGIFAAISFLFGSPVIAAVFLIEAGGIGGPRMPLVLVPGLLAAGIGSLVSTGMGSWTGVDTSAISLQPIPMPAFDRPDLVDFAWTIPLAAAVAVGIFLLYRLGRRVTRISVNGLVLLPAIGLIVGGLAILFSQVEDRGTDLVLFSGQESIGPVVEQAATWSVGALALLIACKGIAYGLAMGSFRGGPVFPAMFLATAAGVMASHLPGLELSPAVAVAMGAAVVAALRLPLAAVVLATLLTIKAGLGVTPLIILGVVVAYLVTLGLPGPPKEEPAPDAA